MAAELAGASARAAHRRRHRPDRAGRVPARLRGGRIMRARLYPLAFALLTVAGCVPGVAEYSKSEAPTQLHVQGATSELAVAFAPGSARLGASESVYLD